MFIKHFYCERRNWLSIKKRFQKIKKQQIFHKSSRLQKIQQFYKQFLFESNYIQTFFFLLINNIFDNTKICVLIVFIIISKRWFNLNTTKFSNSFKSIHVFSKIKTKAKKTKIWTFFFSKSKATIIETISNFVFELYQKEIFTLNVDDWRHRKQYWIV